MLAARWDDLRGIEMVRQTLADRSADAALRLRALATLITAGDKQVLNVAANVLSEPRTNKEFSGQVLAGLGKLDDSQVAAFVLKSYPTLAPESQPKAIEL